MKLLSEDYFQYNAEQNYCVYALKRANPPRYGPRNFHGDVTVLPYSCNLLTKLQEHPIYDTCGKDNIITIEEFITDHKYIISGGGDLGNDGIRKDRNGNFFWGNEWGKLLHINPFHLLTAFESWFACHQKDKVDNSIVPFPLGFTPKITTLSNIDLLRTRPKHENCYANFAITSRNRVQAAIAIQKRQDITTHIVKLERELVWGASINPAISYTERGAVPYPQYMDELSRHRYCICPSGFGADTYRLWESILMNTIPIAENNFCNRVFSKLFPMVLINSYEDLNFDKIDEQMSTFTGYDVSLLEVEKIPALLQKLKKAAMETQ